MERDGFAIALAWPETYCKQSGAWYDLLANYFKISKNHYYKVGHAAIILVDKNGNLYYYDFGRYHAPIGFGRVRSAETDPELHLKTKAKIKANKIENFDEIITEISSKKEFHGEGKLIASYEKICFDKANNRAIEMQKNNPWKYGPFIYSGTNCSRFVRNILLSGNPNLLKKIKLKTQYTFTASPYLNVRNWGKIHETETTIPSVKPETKPILNSVLAEPKNKPHQNAKWYSGEGAGSWYHIERKDTYFLVKKYAHNLEIESIYTMEITENHYFEINKEFQLTFPCHALEKKIFQNGHEFLLRRRISSE